VGGGACLGRGVHRGSRLGRIRSCQPAVPERGLYPHERRPRLLVGGAGAWRPPRLCRRGARRQGSRECRCRRCRSDGAAMTYCVALDVRDGLVMLSDTRTNAGIDNISTFGKMHLFESAGDRVVVMLTAGNLAIAQGVVNLLNEGIESEA